MKNLKIFILFILFIPVSIFAQDFKTIRNGIEYAEITREIDKLPVKINLLRLDLTKVRLDVVHAKDAAIGLEKTSSIAMRHGAFAAINAGFFRIDKSIWEGDDVGTLMIDGKLLSESYANRIAMGISQGMAENKNKVSKQGKPLVVIGHFNFYGSRVEFANLIYIGNAVFEGGLKYAISGINRERKTDEMIVFTPEFHRTTLSNENGIEVVIINQKVNQIINGQGSTVIPADGKVISANGKAKEWILQNVKVGQQVELYYGIDTLDTENRRFFREYTEDIVSGVPQLIKNGKIDITWQEEKSSKSFVETKHPRTAVAKLKDGKFLMVTVDGRSESSGGISLPDLAAFLLEMGATDAMNLDGGGSSTMFLDGKVVNHPSDKEGERSIGDALLVFPRK